jgi:hypothetical protein
MKKIFLIACLGSFAFNATLDAKQTPRSKLAAPARAGPSRTSTPLGVVPIYVSGRRAISVLQVGNHAPVPVVFDTGTSANNLDAGYATQLGVSYTPVQVELGDGTGNILKARQAEIADATLGGVTIFSKTATVFPYKERDVVGIFGPNSFRGRLMVLDLAHGRLIVTDKDPGVPIPADATSYDALGRPALTLHLPGTTLPALIDSGNDSALILPESLAQKIPLRGPLRVAGRAKTLTGERDTYEGDIAGDIRIENIVLRSPTAKFSGKDVANIGLPLMRQLLIGLDPEQQKAWVINQPVLSSNQRSHYIGRYGIRTVKIDGGALIYQRDQRPGYVMRPLSEDLFAIEETGEVVQFRRKDGVVIVMNHVSGGGVFTQAHRTQYLSSLSR